MRCPTDGAELVMAERQGVEIDYCPSCRGIWLDRGELDKILDRAAGAGAPPLASEPAFGGERYGGDRYGGDRYRDDRYRDDRPREDRPREDRRDPRAPYGRTKRRGSWLGDLLDFD